MKVVPEIDIEQLFAEYRRRFPNVTIQMDQLLIALRNKIVDVPPYAIGEKVPPMNPPLPDTPGTPGNAGNTAAIPGVVVPHGDTIS